MWGSATSSPTPRRNIKPNERKRRLRHVEKKIAADCARSSGTNRYSVFIRPQHYYNSVSCPRLNSKLKPQPMPLVCGDFSVDTRCSIRFFALLIEFLITSGLPAASYNDPVPEKGIDLKQSNIYKKY